METKLVRGLFQSGVLVSDVDECLTLFHDVLGMDIKLDARNQIQREKGLSGVDEQLMNVVLLRGEEGVDLEIHQYVEPKAKHPKAMNHNDIGSMHFMLRVDNMELVREKIIELGYEPMTDIANRNGFKYMYFRGPDQMMVELQEGEIIILKK